MQYEKQQCQGGQGDQEDRTTARLEGGGIEPGGYGTALFAER